MAWILRTSLMLTLMKYSVDPNARLTATKRGFQVELTCMYVGNGKVSAVQWFNGSCPNPLLLVRNDSGGQFSVFAGSTSPFDMDQVNSSCNHDNICTLVFNESIDEISTISCTFLDPNPGEPKAASNLTVLSAPIPSAPVTTAPVTSAPVPTEVPGGQTLNTGAIVGIAGVTVAFFAIIAIFAYCKYCKNTGAYNVVGNKDIEVVPIELLEINRYEQQMPDQVQSDTFQDVEQTYGVSQTNN